jgi:serine/threonine-protein kinase
VVAALVAVALIAGVVYVLNYVSSSGSNFAVPSVAGEPLARAEQDIANAHLIARVVREPSTTVARNDVISTSPPAGQQVPKNSTVTLVVSSGAGKVPVPNVVQETAAAAMSQLQALGFIVSEQPAPNSAAPSGTVVRQTPAAGTQAARGSTVTIYVSGGGVPVQNVIGDPAGTAQQILQGEGFIVDTKVVPGPAGSTPGDVFSQTPSSGTLPKGGTVTIYVAQQPTPTPSTPTPTPSTPTPTPTPSQ